MVLFLMRIGVFLGLLLVMVNLSFLCPHATPVSPSLNVLMVLHGAYVLMDSAQIVWYRLSLYRGIEELRPFYNFVIVFYLFVSLYTGDALV